MLIDWVKIKAKIRGAFKSKTMVLSFFMTAFGALNDNITYLQSIMKPEYYGYLAMFAGVAVGILRWVTSHPLEEK
jgi:hypothetical protein